MSYYELMEKAGAKAISQLQVDEIADIYGVIKEYKEVFRSQRGLKDYCQNLVVIDPSGRFIPVNLFKRSPDLLPRAVEKGNIIVIRRIRILNYRLGLQGNSIPTTTFTTFKADNMSLTEIKTPNVDCALRPVDHEAVKQVLRYATAHMSSLFTPQQKQRPLLKTSEILQYTDNFFNYVGMVTTIHRGFNNDRININMTDYTKNPKPYINPYAIQCTLWDNHAKNCPFIQVGDYLLLENVSKKIHNNSLTINLHRSKPEDQFVHKLSTEDIRVRELLKRRASADVGQNAGRASSIRSEVINIRTSCSFKEILIKELDKSETDVFYKTKASIVDYKPKSIDKWIQHWCATCHKTYQSQSIMRCQACGRNIEFVYQFAVLLQDKEGLSLIAYVFKEDGDDLFKNINPKDAYDSRDKKNELKEMIETICKSKAEYDIGLRAYFNLEGILNFRITNTKFIKE